MLSPPFSLQITMDKESLSSYTFLLFTISLSSLLLILSLLSKSRRSNSSRLPPSPPSIPIIGHLHLLRPPIHRSLHNLTARYGPLLYLRFGSDPCIVISTPELARHLIKTHDIAVSDRPLSVVVRQLAYETSGFAFAPYGPYWRFMKKLCMSELLGPRTVEQLRPVRRKELMDVIGNVLGKSRSREPVDLSEELIKLTNNEVMKMAAGTSSPEARELAKEVAELVGTFNLADHIGFLRNWDLQGVGKRVKEVHRRFDGMLERIMKGKEEERRRKGSGGERVKDLLDILLGVMEDEKAEMKITREHIKGFITDIFTAGTDSTAATIEWALALIINHPTVLQKLREEIDITVGKGRIVDETDIPNLPYLQCVVKESMRIHPAAPLATRLSTKDFDVAGYNFPANTILFFNLWSIGRDPDHWEAPHEFRPERFEEKDWIDLKGQNFELLPFGSGRRGCPGMSLAIPVVHVTVAAMVQCFELEVGGEGKVDMEEGIGLVSARASPLLCVPIARLNPFPSF